MNSDPPALPPFFPERLAFPRSLLKLLVSVRDAEEVLAALAGGADWIDLKEPSAGPLAAVKVCVARAAVQVLAGQRTMSAALGELRDWEVASANELLAVKDIGVVKLGLAGCVLLDDWQQRWQAVAEEAARNNKKLVAVVYADWQQANAPTPEVILRLAQTEGCRYLLIDTYEKSSGTVFDHFERSELVRILHSAKEFGMTTVLAGSLSRNLIGQIPTEGVDIVAVRGAVCRGDRTTRVDAGLVESFRQSLAAKFA